jgi:peptide/nickel transport system permease protein
VLRYVVRRIAYMIPIVLGVALLTFILFNVYGGTESAIYRQLGKHATAEEIRVLRHEYGLDLSYPVQFLRFLKQIVTFDFGRSSITQQKVSKMILDGLVPSLSLMVPAFIFGTLLAICMSLISAFYRNRFIDRAMVIMSVAGMSVSILAYIIVGQYVLAYKLRLFPIQGYEFGLQSVKYLVLPGLIYVVAALGADVRLYRTIMLNETNQDYVRTAMAKGVSKSSILFKHVLKNSMIPIITQVVITIPFLYTGSLLLESFFGIPGLGDLGITAVTNGDWPVLRTLTFIGAVIFIFANLASDLLYALVDPRVRLQ